MENRRAGEVAAELKLPIEGVYTAKSPRAQAAGGRSPHPRRGRAAVGAPELARPANRESRTECLLGSPSSFPCRAPLTGRTMKDCPSQEELQAFLSTSPAGGPGRELPATSRTAPGARTCSTG